MFSGTVVSDMIGHYTKMNLGGFCGVWVAATKKGIVHVSLGGSERRFLDQLPVGMEWKKDDKKFRAFSSHLKKFSAGKKVSFDIALDIRSGTPFQRRVWKEIAAIPWGRTASYSALAAGIGKAKAVRAVANACGANPLPIVVPCHRVIASDGTIGGFSSGGAALKKKILALEKIFTT